MKTYRPHRFPPLSRFTPAHAASPGDAERAQAALAEGFQQGMDRGYREGYDSGVERGVAEGRLQGLREGREEGQAEARAAVLARWQAHAAPVDAALAALHQAQDDYQKALRSEVVDLVAKVARQVIRAELTLQPSQLLALVEEALKTMPPASGEIEVFFNPEDLERIRELDPARARAWKLMADSRLDAGECRVHCGGQEADAGCRHRLQACMEQIGAQLLDADPLAAEPAPDTEPAA
jgi:flagellar assembly protein FliH